MGYYKKIVCQARTLKYVLLSCCYYGFTASLMIFDNWITSVELAPIIIYLQIEFYIIQFNIRINLYWAPPTLYKCTVSYSYITTSILCVLSKYVGWHLKSSSVNYTVCLGYIRLTKLLQIYINTSTTDKYLVFILAWVDVVMITFLCSRLRMLQWLAIHSIKGS